MWVNSRLRWVTGIGRKTTCDDVISVLLRGDEDGKSKAPETPSQKVSQGFAIMERWRRMERPLDGRSRILRVWNAWGDAQNEVKFTLKRVSDWEADSGRGSPSRDSCRKRKHHHRGSKLSWSPHHQTIHPRRLAQLHHHHQKDGNKLPETIERLMKLILAQGETIQSQLRKLHDRENQIEHLEGETHRARVETLGSNYLLETYLKANAEDADDEEEKGNDSGVVTEGGNDQTPPPTLDIPQNLATNSEKFEKTPKETSEIDENKKDIPQEDDAIMQDLKARIDLFEKLVRVNKRLEREEECLVRLHIKFRRLRSSHQQSDGLRVLPEEDVDDDTIRIKDALLKDLERVRLELERGTSEMEHNALALSETEALLEARRHYLRRLQSELEVADRETERLGKDMDLMRRTAGEGSENQQKSASKVPTTALACSSANDTDSNSDTGLSSLHSSSEEGVYVLDTLV